MLILGLKLCFWKKTEIDVYPPASKASREEANFIKKETHTNPFTMSNISLSVCMYVWWLFVEKSDYFYNVKYQDLCATINPTKTKDLEDQKQFLKHLYNNNVIGFL